MYAGAWLPGRWHGSRQCSHCLQLLRSRNLQLPIPQASFASCLILRLQVATVLCWTTTLVRITRTMGLHVLEALTCAHHCSWTLNALDCRYICAPDQSPAAAAAAVRGQLSRDERGGTRCV